MEEQILFRDDIQGPYKISINDIQMQVPGRCLVFNTIEKYKAVVAPNEMTPNLTNK